jgi:hypothetical protein
MITPTALSGALLLVFAPSAGSFSLHAPTPTLRRMQPRQVAVVAPQMMALPAFGGGGKKKDAYEGPSEEAQAALRMIGVSEDATYDEVTEAYQELCTKYKGETKRLIRLQAAKDIVLEDRLRQRMAGAFKSDIADRVGKNMDIGDNRKAPKEPLITLPAWAEPYMELPTKKLLLRNALLFGAISIMSIVAKHLAPTSCAMGVTPRTPDRPPAARAPLPARAAHTSATCGGVLRVRRLWLRLLPAVQPRHPRDQLHQHRRDAGESRGRQEARLHRGRPHHLIRGDRGHPLAAPAARLPARGGHGGGGRGPGLLHLGHLLQGAGGRVLESLPIACSSRETRQNTRRMPAQLSVGGESRLRGWPRVAGYGGGSARCPRILCGSK